MSIGWVLGCEMYYMGRGVWGRGVWSVDIKSSKKV